MTEQIDKPVLYTDDQGKEVQQGDIVAHRFWDGWFATSGSAEALVDDKRGRQRLKITAYCLGDIEPSCRLVDPRKYRFVKRTDYTRLEPRIRRQ